MAVYGTTLAWMLSLPHRGRKWTSGLATVFAVTGFVDTVIVAVQAARGTFSHFHKSTAPAEKIMLVVFGNAVLLIMLANLALAIILAFQRVHADRAMSRAIHTGLALAVAGMALGFLIPIQGKAETALTTSGQRVSLSSGHSVGVPDGGPGLPPDAVEHHRRRPAGPSFRRHARPAGHADRRSAPGGTGGSLSPLTRRPDPHPPDRRARHELHRPDRPGHLAGPTRPAPDPPRRPDPDRRRPPGSAHRPGHRHGPGNAARP
ncbi:hypothetical protein ACFSTC_52260 [Nonomuraea ferruginea]